MRNEIRNMDASVKARLKNIAKEYKKTFNLILQLYMQERLLYRLSVSEYKDNFILKGGLFFVFNDWIYRQANQRYRFSGLSNIK